MKKADLFKTFVTSILIQVIWIQSIAMTMPNRGFATEPEPETPVATAPTLNATCSKILQSDLVTRLPLNLPHYLLYKTPIRLWKDIRTGTPEEKQAAKNTVFKAPLQGITTSLFGGALKAFPLILGAMAKDHLSVTEAFNQIVMNGTFWLFQGVSFFGYHGTNTFRFYILGDKNLTRNEQRVAAVWVSVLSYFTMLQIGLALGGSAPVPGYNEAFVAYTVLWTIFSQKITKDVFLKYVFSHKPNDKLTDELFKENSLNDILKGNPDRKNELKERIEALRLVANENPELKAQAETIIDDIQANRMPFWDKWTGQDTVISKAEVKLSALQEIEKAVKEAGKLPTLANLELVENAVSAMKAKVKGVESTVTPFWFAWRKQAQHEPGTFLGMKLAKIPTLRDLVSSNSPKANVEMITIYKKLNAALNEEIIEAKLAVEAQKVIKEKLIKLRRNIADGDVVPGMRRIPYEAKTWLTANWIGGSMIALYMLLVQSLLGDKKKPDGPLFNAVQSLKRMIAEHREETKFFESSADGQLPEVKVVLEKQAKQIDEIQTELENIERRMTEQREAAAYDRSQTSGSAFATE